MDPIKTDAIVLRVVEFSETSCIVTLFTRTLGKISTIAKGARRKKSPFEAALDLIAICRIVFLHKSSQSLDILTEAKLQRRFRSSAKDLDRFYAGLYLIELLNLMTDDADPHEDLFDEAVAAIQLIDAADFVDRGDGDNLQSPQGAGLSVKHALINFEIRMLDLLGHLPMLTNCVDCGRPKTTISRVQFGLNRGGIICQNCRPGKTNIVSLSSQGLELLLKMTKAKKKPIEENLIEENLIDLSDLPGYGEVRQLISKYITHLIGHPPRLHQYLGNLSN
jgi:DNA repair protein RecO (recombination protein O)